MAIDVGYDPGTSGSEYGFAGYTCLLLHNPANATGTITTFKIYCTESCTSAKVGSFYGSELSYTNRDYYTVGAISGTAIRTFTGIDFDITTGDFLGIYSADGATTYVYGGVSDDAPYCLGDQMGTGANTYTSFGPYVIMIYGTGTETAVGQPLIKRLGGVQYAALNRGVF
jgi:hypothetical protein